MYVGASKVSDSPCEANNGQGVCCELYPVCIEKHIKLIP